MQIHQVGDLVVAPESVVETESNGEGPRYAIASLLGQGSMCQTYAATEVATGQSVAIKVLSLLEATDWKTVELFEREAKVLKHLDHPNIPNYLNHFQIELEQDQRFYLVQELAEGYSFATLVEGVERKPWRANEKQARWIATQVLGTLTYLHGLTPPVIHRDIKPENLMLKPGGQVYLVDFNAMQAVYRNTKSYRCTFVGTLGYMPPEQFSGQACFASDLYSLGATLVYLLSGKSPADLPEEDLKIQFRGVTPGSAALLDWLDHLLEPMAEDRFATAEQALATLQGKAIPQAAAPPLQTFGEYVDPQLDEAGVWLADQKFDSAGIRGRLRLGWDGWLYGLDAPNRNMIEKWDG